MSVSVLVPVYNGAPYLQNCIDQLVSTLSKGSEPYEIIVCEDGSTDGTKQLCEVLKQRYPSVRFIHATSRLGRGGALSRAASEAKGNVIAYVDVDMATDVSHLPELLLLATNGSDVVTGSRYLPTSHSRRTVSRLALSRVYNALVRYLLHSSVSDHQCGFKAFKREAMERVIPRIRSNHWFWDTEFLVWAQALGLRVTEIPVDWSEMPQRSTMRLRKDVPYFLREIMALRGELRRAKEN